jgi:hypothetical protein
MTDKLDGDRTAATELSQPKPEPGAIAASPTRREYFTAARPEYFCDRPRNTAGVNTMTDNILQPNLSDVQQV